MRVGGDVRGAARQLPLTMAVFSKAYPGRGDAEFALRAIKRAPLSWPPLERHWHPLDHRRGNSSKMLRPPLSAQTRLRAVQPRPEFHALLLRGPDPKGHEKYVVVRHVTVVRTRKR